MAGGQGFGNMSFICKFAPLINIWKHATPAPSLRSVRIILIPVSTKTTTKSKDLVAVFLRSIFFNKIIDTYDDSNK